ncbi:MAG: ribokinase [Cyanobacteria bacterium P01_D01_bin.105]
MAVADVVVLGSVNMDLVAQVDRLPKPGETLTGRGFSTVPGGKGANQAVAAARLGVKTAMVGRVGNDGFGQMLGDRLKAEHINTSALGTSKTSPTGTALITLSPTDNQIVITAGANAEMGEIDLDRLTPFFDKAKVLLLQFEVPLPTVEKAAALAYLAGLTVIVDPAPAPSNGGKLSADFCEYISILTPNQTEAQQLTGIDTADVEGAIAAAEMLQRQGIEVVIVKMGSLGAACATDSGNFVIPAFPVSVTDTIAAGDAFNGGLAAALCTSPKLLENIADHELLRPALDYASAVAALAVTESGAQSSMPTAARVEEFLQKR